MGQAESDTYRYGSGDRYTLRGVRSERSAVSLDKKYTWLWILWIVAFGIIEYAALKDKDKGDTLSEHVRKLIGTETPGRNWENWIGRVALAGLFCWLIPHFFTGSI